MKLFSHSSIILPVNDVKATAEYYRDKLGFNISFLWQDPPSYAVVNRDDAVGLHFTSSDHPIEVDDQARLYIFVHNADEVYKEYQNAGVKIIEPINDTDYHMREFVIADINGYKLVLGKGL
ncbi:VOC family protein [Ekhidna sp. To15]|uniref:VOC family protein n=1 Tax=Ekhidna sp. To15 TaxID=3395267 RepID=UPI003F521FA1